MLSWLILRILSKGLFLNPHAAINSVWDILDWIFVIVSLTVMCPFILHVSIINSYISGHVSIKYLKHPFNPLCVHSLIMYLLYIHPYVISCIHSLGQCSFINIIAVVVFSY